MGLGGAGVGVDGLSLAAELVVLVAPGVVLGVGDCLELPVEGVGVLGLVVAEQRIRAVSGVVAQGGGAARGVGDGGGGDAAVGRVGVHEFTVVAGGAAPLLGAG